MVLNINGRTIQTFGASRMVQGEHRAEPVEFRLSMPGASGLSWYLGYERADGEGNGVVPLEVHGSDDDLRLVWFPTRTATDVVGKLAIIVYGLEGEVTEEGDDRRWSTYPAYLTVSAGLDVTQAEEIEPSVLESYLVRFQKLLFQTSALRDAVATDKTKVAEYVAEADTSATTASQKADEAKGYADTAKAEREATEAVKTAVEAKATEVEGKASEVVSEVAKAKGYSDSASASASGASASASSARGYAATAEREAETATQKASLAYDHAESARGYAASASASASSAESISASFDGKVNTAKAEIEAGKTEALGEISAAISGVDAKRAEAVAELDQKKTEIEGVYQEDLGRLNSALTELENDTYRKAEVDSKVAEATPSDYDQLKRQVREQGYSIENQQALTDGIVKLDHHEPTEDGKLDIQSSKFVAPNAMVEEVRGRSVTSRNLADPSTKTNFYCDGSGLAYSSDGMSSILVPITVGKSYTILQTVGTTLTRVAFTKTFALSNGTPLFKANGGTYSATGDGSYVAGTPLTLSPTDGDFKAMLISYWRNTSSVSDSDALGSLMVVEGTSVTPYQPYFSGIKDASVTGVRAVGRNLWDEKWKQGYIYNGTQIVPEANSVSSDDFTEVEAGKTYSFFYGNGLYLKVSYYDANKVYLSNTGNIYTKKIDVPVGVKYIKFTVTYGSAHPYQNDIAVCEGDDASYTPYMEPSLIPLSITLKEGDVYKPAEGKVQPTKKKAVLSDYAWTPQSEDVYYAVVPDIRQEASMGLMNDRYETTTLIYSNASRPDKTISSRNNSDRVYIKDSAFVGHNAEWVRASLEGSVMLYETASPLDPIPAPTISPFIRVEAGGTVTIESDGATAEATIFYQTKYV